MNRIACDLSVNLSFQKLHLGTFHQRAYYLLPYGGDLGLICAILISDELQLTPLSQDALRCGNSKKGYTGT